MFVLLHSWQNCNMNPVLQKQIVQNVEKLSLFKCHHHFHKLEKKNLKFSDIAWRMFFTFFPDYILGWPFFHAFFYAWKLWGWEVGNRGTWDRFRPRTKVQENKIWTFWILNFVLSLNLSQDNLHFLLLRTLKNYF